MNDMKIIVAVLALVLLALVIYLINWAEKRWLSRLNSEKFREGWLAVQELCRDKSTWPLAVINGDKLLDEALRKRGFKGKNTGGRLVSARKILSDNDKVWFAHKLRNRLVHEEDIKLTEAIVKNALAGIRQALKDLGAL